MAESYIVYTGNGSTTNYAIPFPFLQKAHLVAKLDGITKSQGSDFSVTASTLTWSLAPGNGVEIHISRYTPRTALLVDFTDGANLTEEDLDTVAKQNFFIAQEIMESSLQADPIDFAAGGRRIKDVGTPEAAADATTKAYVDAHTGNTNNPHAVTKTQIGLGNADNTSDANKPISSAQQTALDAKFDKYLTILTPDLSGGGS